MSRTGPPRGLLTALAVVAVVIAVREWRVRRYLERLADWPRARDVHPGSP